MKKINDPVILGIIAGLAGNCLKTAGNLFNRYVLKVSQFTYIEVAAGLFMRRKESHKPLGQIVGGIADFLIGSMMGVPLVYLLKYTKKDYALVKGIGIGGLIWIGMYGALGRAFGAWGFLPANASTNLSSFLNHSLYGIGASIVATKLGDPSLFAGTEDRPQQLELVKPQSR